MEVLTSYSAMDDNELVESSKSNPEVFGELVLRYQERLFRFIRRISYFCIEDIEDIVQETFIKAYRSLNIFDTDLKFSTWIYQIARNTTIDAIRKKHTRPQTVCLEQEDVIKFLRSDSDMQINLETKEQLKIMQGIINTLPHKYREVMILRFLEEKNYEEIMDIIQKPKGTVAALINRGRKMLFDEAKKIKLT
ncbi:MAG: sigma-70 family RNA polymerase sigma factor [Candidatus Moranbacteria bacterium]|jgi:RNA polymerase sigma-70 factor (ECF subfamily)|nr:sigma-70 family RNA polymerase sigma factor [Candidatus Moranbacteria bacterium]